MKKGYIFILTGFLLIAGLIIYWNFFRNVNTPVVSRPANKDSAVKSIDKDKAIAAQTRQEVAHYYVGQDSISFQTGKVNAQYVEALEKTNGKPSPDRFTGKNYINTDEGFIYAVSHPEKWKLKYDPRYKKNPDYAILTINGAGGVRFRVNMGLFEEELDVETYLKKYYLPAMYNSNTGHPEVKYDYKNQVAFVKGSMVADGVDVYIKVCMKGFKTYVATLQFPKGKKNSEEVKEMTEMVTTFSLINQ